MIWRLEACKRKASLPTLRPPPPCLARTQASMRYSTGHGESAMLVAQSAIGWPWRTMSRCGGSSHSCPRHDPGLLPKREELASSGLSLAGVRKLGEHSEAGARGQGPPSRMRAMTERKTWKLVMPLRRKRSSNCMISSGTGTSRKGRKRAQVQRRWLWSSETSPSKVLGHQPASSERCRMRF